MTICCITFDPCRSLREQIWPYHKKWTSTQCHHLVVLEYSMLYTKFQCHRPLGSEEGHFWRFLPYVGLEAILVIWPWTFKQIFIPTSHGGAIGNLASNGLSVFLGKEVWKCRIWVSMKGLDLGLSCTHIFDYMYQLSPHRLQQFLGNLQLKHFPYKEQKGPILTLM